MTKFLNVDYINCRLFYPLGISINFFWPNIFFTEHELYQLLTFLLDQRLGIYKETYDFMLKNINIMYSTLITIFFYKKYMG